MEAIKQIVSKPQLAIIRSTASLNLFLAGVGCFEGNTIVNTLLGYKRIKDINIGEWVLTLNESGKYIEYKEVVNKFQYKTGDNKQNCIKFVLTNDNLIICTNEHRIYFKGAWVKAEELAFRKMEASEKYKQSVFHQQHGETFNNATIQQLHSCNNETGKGWKWLFKNCNIAKRKEGITYNKDTQDSCTDVYSKSGKQTRDKSYKRDKDGQSSYESSMGDKIREYYSCFCNWVGIKCGIKASRTYINGRFSFQGEDNAENRNDIQCNCKSDGIQKVYNRRLLYPQLAAREISLEDIKQIEYLNCDYVYDLEVKDNHNFCVTTDNIIVHNSGKTFIGGIISYRFISAFPKMRGFIASNTYLQLTQSTLFRIREYWKSIGITEWDKTNPSGRYVINKKPPAHFITDGHNFDDYYGIISFINGGIIFTGSLEHSEAHYGKEICWAILDETKDSDETDVKEVILSRLRQKGMFIKDGKLSNEGRSYNPAYFLTTPARVDWINEMFELDKYIDEINAKIYSDKTFFQKEFSDKFVTISSTYHNQRNLPDNYISGLKERYTDERFKSLIYANPFTVTGGEFYSSFSRVKHVAPLKYDPSLPIHITFDQNTVPYNTALIFQVKENIQKGYWDFRCIDEICLQNPRNSTEEVCEEFISRYPNHKSGLYYYGDASGHARSTLSKDFKHHYEVIEYKLARYLNNHSDRTLIVNPDIITRRDFMNRILEEKLPIRLTINETCKNTIADFMYTKQDIEGKKDKHVITDPDTGEKYQKYGHCGDAVEYEAVELFKNFYNG